MRRLASLALAMRIEEPALISLAAKASELYRVAQEVPKDDGTVRRTYDARRPLKDVHRLIKLEILDHVAFPEYLTGSIKGRDSKIRAMVHKLECDLDAGADPASVIAALPTVTGKVSLLAHFHPGEAKPLKERLAAIKQRIDDSRGQRRVASQQ